MRRLGRVLNVVGAAVVVLVGVAVVCALLSPITHCKPGRPTKARADVRGISEAVELFRNDCGFLPPTLDSLLAKNRKTVNCPRFSAIGYLDRLPLDPWGNEYAYSTDGQSYRVVSYGADGRLGGEGIDADIDSRDLQPAA